MCSDAVKGRDLRCRGNEGMSLSKDIGKDVSCSIMIYKGISEIDSALSSERLVLIVFFWKLVLFILYCDFSIGIILNIGITLNIESIRDGSFQNFYYAIVEIITMDLRGDSWVRKM